MNSANILDGTTRSSFVDMSDNDSLSNTTSYMVDKDASLSNTTSHISPAFSGIRSAIFALLAIATITLNIISIIVVRKMHQINNVTRFLLKSLNIVDLCHGVFGLLPPVAFSAVPNWTPRELFCALHANLFEILPLIDLTILVMINAERYIACTRPLRHTMIVTLKRVKIIMVVVVLFWIFMLTTFMLTFMAPEVFKEYEHYSSLLHFDSRYGICVFDFSFAPEGFIVYLSCVVVLPIMIVAFMIFRLLIIARRLSRSRKLAGHGGFVHNRQTTNNKGLYTFLLITLSMALVWMPFLMVNICQVSYKLTVSIYFILISQIILYSFSWLNVLIYFWRNEEFRKIAIRLFK